MRTSGNKAKMKKKEKKNETTTTTTIIHTIKSHSERKKEFQVNIYKYTIKRMHQWLLSLV